VPAQKPKAPHYVVAQLSESELEDITARPLKDGLNTFCSSQSKFPNQQCVDAGKVTELFVSDNVNAGKEASSISRP